MTIKEFPTTSVPAFAQSGRKDGAAAPLEDKKTVISMMSLNHISERLKRAVARRRLGSTEFSIISNNCWGGHVYHDLGLEYTSPFVGLFLSPNSYLRLISDFDRLMAEPLSFKPRSDEGWINDMRERSRRLWPIGSIGGQAEIQFMHYQSESEARSKWLRRSSRLSQQPDRRFFKFCDRDGCNAGHVALFDKLPLKNKVFFSTQSWPESRCGVVIPLKEPCVPQGLTLARLSPQAFDTVGWILGKSGRPTIMGKWLNCV